MSSSSTSSTKPDLQPDDVCAVCQTTREMHGDKNHKFDTENDVPQKLDPPPRPRQDPPTPRGITDQIKAVSFAMLMEVLAEKNILDAKDIIRIFTAEPNGSSTD